MKNLLRQAVLLLVTIGVLVGVAVADPRLGAGSNPADLTDPYAYGVNPALDEMTRTQVAVGYQILHWGLLSGAADLNTGNLIYAGRKSYGGVHVGMSWVDTPLWGDRQIQAGYGRRVVGGLSLGATVGINQRAFDRDQMDLSQGSTSDPLLTGSLSKTVPVTSLAAAYSLPLAGVTAGLVLENPFEPVVAMDERDDSVVLPAVLRAGLGWEREAFQITAGLADDRWRTTYQVAARGFIQGGHGAVFRYETDQWALGARFGVSKKVWVEYSYSQPLSDLAEAASGTHGLVICLHTGGRDLPRVAYEHSGLDDRPYRPTVGETGAGEPLFPDPPGVEVPDFRNGTTDYRVAAMADTALIRVKRIKRVFGPGVDVAQIRRLPRWRVGVLDTTWSDRVTWEVVQGMVPAQPESEQPRGNYSEDYRRRMGEMGSGLVIAAEADQLDRARFLARKVDEQTADGSTPVEIREMVPLSDPELVAELSKPVGSGPLPAVEEVALFQYEYITFDLESLGSDHRVTDWVLEIRDSDDRPVRRLSGAGSPPEIISWDWRDTAGQVVPVDSYTYTLGWRERGVPERWTPRREILIARQLMQRTLEFGANRDPLKNVDRANSMLILDPGRKGLSSGGTQPGSEPSDSPYPDKGESP